MEDGLEVVMAVTAPLENGSEVAQVGNEFEAYRGLLGSVTAIEIGADPDVGGSAEKLTVVIEMVGQGLERCLGLVTFGCCLLYTSPSPRDLSTPRMPSSA